MQMAASLEPRQWRWRPGRGFESGLGLGNDSDLGGEGVIQDSFTDFWLAQVGADIGDILLREERMRRK